MRRSVERRSIAAVIGLAGLAWAGVACAEGVGEQPPPTVPQPSMPAEARAVLERALETYKKVPGYSDVLVMNFELDAKTAAGEPAAPPPNVPPSESMKVWFGSPDRFRVEYQDLTVICDGSMIWGVNHKEAWYTEERAYQAGGGLAEMSRYKRFTTLHLPLTTMVRRPQTVDEFLRRIEITGARAVMLEGRECTEITGIQHQQASHSPVRIYFSRETGLMERFVGDITKSYRATVEKYHARAGDAAPPEYPKTVESAGWVNSLTEVRIGEQPAELFVYKPDPSYTRRGGATKAPAAEAKKTEELPPADSGESRYEEPAPASDSKDHPR